MFDRLVQGRTRRLATAVVAILVAGWAGFASAQTDVSGGKLGDTTWDQSGSPYILKGDVEISSGKKLTIKEGAEIRAESSDFLQTGRDTGRVELRISGELEISGTEQSPVVIEGTSNSEGHWVGLILKSGASNVSIDSLELRDAENGVSIETTNSVDISNSRFFRNAQDGIRVLEGTPRLDAISSVNNGVNGIRAEETGGATITNAILRSNDDRGMSVTCGSGQQSNISLHSSVVYENRSDGIRTDCSSGAKNVTIRNTIIASNGRDGVDRDGAASVTVEHCNVWDHPGADYEGAFSTTNNISSRPLFQNPPDDLRLQQTSFCVDAGTNTDAPDRDFDGKTRPLDGDNDGTADYDIGAFEYGQGAVCGNGTVEQGESCDDGSENGDYGKCASDCSGPGPRCGDGTVDGPEECDDGNTMDGDGCSSTCTTEDSASDVGPDATADTGPGDSGTNDDTGTSADAGSSADAGEDGESSDAVGGSDTSGVPDASADTGTRGTDDGGSDVDGGGESGEGCGCGAADSTVPGPLSLGAVVLLTIAGWRRLG